MTKVENIHYPKTYSAKRHFGGFVEAVGYSWPELLKSANLHDALDDKGGIQVTPREFLRIWESVANKKPDIVRVVEFLDQANASKSHPAARAFAASPTLGEGLKRVQEIKPLESPMKISFVNDLQALRIRYHLVDDSIELTQNFAFLQVLWLHSLILSQLPDLAEDVQIEVPTNPQIDAAWLNVLPQRYTLGDDVALLVSHDALATPLPSTHPETSPFVQRVEWIIRSILASGRASIEDVARELNTSKRNLQRRLQAEGISFSELLLETRMKLAEEYVQDPTLTMQEIAFLLAYSEPSALYRAYRRHRGQKLPYRQNGN